MISRYREVFFGLLIGLAAGVIDVIMHARMQDRSFAEELMQPHIEMLFYRILFLALGVALGLLLWKKNQRERESRHLAEPLWINLAERSPHQPSLFSVRHVGYSFVLGFAAGLGVTSGPAQ